MKILILQLSDIHLKETGNTVLKKLDDLSNAVKNLCVGIDKLFLVISGDIAFSGKSTEYLHATELIDGIIARIESYASTKVNIVMVPGNHDCDFDTVVKEIKIREALVKTICDKPEEAIHDALIEQCCEVQKEFEELAKTYQNPDRQIFADKLLSVLEYDHGQYGIVFYCYNSAWLSQKDEQPGKLNFPFKKYSKELFKHKANLIISVLHHPLNWQHPATFRDFRAHIEKTSDIVLTGHDHVASKRRLDDLEGNYVEYIEGSLLQDNINEANTGFNILLIDLEKQLQKIINYKWNGSIYNPLSGQGDWKSYRKSIAAHKDDYELNRQFEVFLNDAGAMFTHPYKSNLTIEDIFVCPYLRDMNSEKTEGGDVLKDVIDSGTLFKQVHTPIKLLLVGEEKSGKTSVCRKLYKFYFKNDIIPIYIDGHRIKSGNIDEFNNLIDRCFEEQYCVESLELFHQLDREKKILIIDDFENTRLNVKYKSILLSAINQYYSNIIITGNELFRVGELVYEKEKRENVFRDYQQYELMEFGHLLRNKLINKWNLLGREQTIEEEELIRRNDNAKQVIDTIIGKNYVPSHPVFLLIILQTIEAGTPHNLKESAYGHYYAYLIVQALGRLRINQDEVDAYYNYITELAFRFFQLRKVELTESELHKFHDWIVKEYSLVLSFAKVVGHLIEAGILERNEDLIKFRYNYVYYFFVAKYLSNNISNGEIKAVISGLCERLYREEFANIIVFLTHHSKDPFILDQIISKAKSIFSEYAPVKMEKDIQIVNNLLKEIPRLVLEQKDVQQHREDKYKEHDRAELADAENNVDEVESRPDVQEAVVELDLISRLNLAFKAIEIIGQVLKNYYGSLKGSAKYSLGEEAYFVGLRSLNSFFALLGDNPESLVSEIKSIISNRGVVKEEKVEEMSKKLLFFICEFICYGFVKKIAGSLGSEKLKETFKSILDNNNYASVRLVDVSVKLDFYKSFPFEDVKKIAEDMKSNVLALTLLRRMVINYLYMFPTEYDEKQKICSMLGIPTVAQRVIDMKSTQKKLT